MTNLWRPWLVAILGGTVTLAAGGDVTGRGREQRDVDRSRPWPPQIRTQRVPLVSRDVAELAAEMCGLLFAKTTAAQIPVDGGNERVI